MPEKLREIVARYEELERLMLLPENYTDVEAYSRLAKEQKELAPVVSVYHALLRAQQAQEEAEQMLSDPELRELAQEELHSARAEQEHLREELKVLLLPRDPNDEKNVILEVRAGSAVKRVRCSRRICCGCTGSTPSAAAGRCRL